MAWTNPRTWVAAEVVTASEMNTHVRDNFLYLYGGPRMLQRVVGASNIADTRNTASFVDIVNATLSITISAGSRLVVYLTHPSTGGNGYIQQANNNTGLDAAYMQCLVGATVIGITIIGGGSNTANFGTSQPLPGPWMTQTSPGAGTFTVKLQGRITTATGSAALFTSGVLVCEEWSA